VSASAPSLAKKCAVIQASAASVTKLRSMIDDKHAAAVLVVVADVEDEMAWRALESELLSVAFNVPIYVTRAQAELESYLDSADALKSPSLMGQLFRTRQHAVASIADASPMQTPSFKNVQVCYGSHEGVQ
jgi:hypothetical protein